MQNDIALSNTRDLYFNAENDFRLINGINYVGQRVGTRLRWFLGEWYLNITLGVPYFQEILIPNPNEISVVDYIKQQILSTDGIESIESFNVNFDTGNNRVLQISFSAITNYGRLTMDEIYTVTMVT
jgi:hypothetical protein